MLLLNLMLVTVFVILLAISVDEVVDALVADERATQLQGDG